MRDDTVLFYAVLLQYHAVYAGRRSGGTTNVRPSCVFSKVCLSKQFVFDTLPVHAWD